MEAGFFMRIIAGKAGGIRLKSIKGREVRPTLDRVKEAIFNMIAYYIEDAEVLDLFSGFGSLGIEALSRGAAHADLIEVNGKHIDIIKENLKISNLENKASVIQNDVFNYLESCSKSYDLIFMDPPYQENMTEKALNLIIKNNILKKDGLIISERSSAEGNLEADKLKIIKKKKYGNSLIDIYSFE
jgi:16S rRNA (guanine966-N2)-methyltransferase